MTGVPLSTPARLAAIVLHFGRPVSTLTAVRSLLASTRSIDDVLVIDNDEVAVGGWGLSLASESERIRYLPMGANLGFSGGVNTGIRAALARGVTGVLLLNSDAEVSADTLGLLEAAMNQNPALGIVGPAIVEAGDASRIESLGLSYNATSGRMWNIGSGSRERPPNTARPVAGVTGCAMLIRREVFDAIGLFAEEYFFGLEDLDFCLRARRAGWESACVPAATVLHEGGASIGAQSPRRLYFAARNHLLLARRTSPDAGRIVVAFRTASIMALNVAHAVRAPGASLWARLGAVARGTRDYFAGRFGPDEESSRKQAR